MGQALGQYHLTGWVYHLPYIAHPVRRGILPTAVKLSQSWHIGNALALSRCD